LTEALKTHRVIAKAVTRLIKEDQNSDHKHPLSGFAFRHSKSVITDLQVQLENSFARVVPAAARTHAFADLRHIVELAVKLKGEMTLELGIFRTRFPKTNSNTTDPLLEDREGDENAARLWICAFPAFVQHVKKPDSEMLKAVCLTKAKMKGI
jgi:hypothetical protein